MYKQCQTRVIDETREDRLIERMSESGSIVDRATRAPDVSVCIAEEAE
jgi:hypothetical protein